MEVHLLIGTDFVGKAGHNAGAARLHHCRQTRSAETGCSGWHPGRAGRCRPVRRSVSANACIDAGATRYNNSVSPTTIRVAAPGSAPTATRLLSIVSNTSSGQPQPSVPRMNAVSFLLVQFIAHVRQRLVWPVCAGARVCRRFLLSGYQDNSAPDTCFVKSTTSPV